MGKLNVAIVIFSVLFVVNLVLLVFSMLASAPLLAPTQSEVTLGSWCSIGLIGMASGIVFEDVLVAPLDDDPAQGNDGGTAGATLYGIQSIDSSVPIQILVRGSDDLKTVGDDVIPLDDESYASSQTNTAGIPSVDDEIPFGLVDVVMPGGPLQSGDTLAARFWLDIVASDQPAGTYQNTIIFTAQEDGGSNC